MQGVGFAATIVKNRNACSIDPTRGDTLLRSL